MNTIEVKDPPHLGFSQTVIEQSIKRTSNLKFVLKLVENKLTIRTSTPNYNIKSNSVMDISFSKYYQNAARQIDNDSGYMSQNQESNSESLLEGFTENGQMVSEIKTVYLGEDALLERPEINLYPNVVVTPTRNKTMVGSIEEIEASVSTESEHFSILKDSNESDISEASTVISEINSIIIHQGCANIEKICDMSDDSNIENNINFLNISNNKSSNFSDSYSSSKRLSYEDKHNILCISNDELNKKSLEQNCNLSTISTNISNPLSPELFSDEDVETKLAEVFDQNFTYKEKYVLKQDQKLIKNVQSALCGVLPPPSLTNIYLTVEQILERYEANKHLFWTKDHSSQTSIQCKCINNECCECINVMHKTKESKSLLFTSSDQKCVKMSWPKIMEERYHGLYYNRSKVSEDFELLCMKYAERYVGCETQSTCTVFQQSLPSSPLKRKANKLRWAVKSPGRRLSHLAKRRITFSSANLQTSSGSSTSVGTHSRQIVMDSKRFQLLSRKRSPLKKSPRKSPKKSPKRSPKKKIRTPSSSAKKRLSLQLQSISKQNHLNGSTSTLRASSTKRALFQSPDKSTSSLSKSLLPSTCGTSNLSPFKKRMTPKCALFTSPLKNSITKTDKRKRIDSEDNHPCKLPRSISLQDAEVRDKSVKQGLLRVKSEMNLSASQHLGELSAHHKKKLQWAVYEALRSQNIGINHPQFKQYASVLARVTRRFLPNLSANAPRPEGGTSDRMLRIARQHIHAVMKGKSVEEIIQNFEINRLKNAKPSGYIGPEIVRGDVSTARNRDNILKDRLNTMSNEKKQIGLNRDELIKTTLKFENRVDRARRIINFDNENNSGIR